nr:MAG TPA: hypothetical protein [Caudoviricetes sp.]
MEKVGFTNDYFKRVYCGRLFFLFTGGEKH